MKRILLLLSLLVGISVSGADSANDFIFTQRKTDNSGNIQRNIPASGAATTAATFRSTLGIPGLTGGNTFTGDQAVTGNVLVSGSVSVGVGGSVAGAVEFGQGTAPSTGTTMIKMFGPASITSYNRVLEGSAGSTGLYLGTVSGTTVTDSKIGTVTVALGGTGGSSLTAYAPIFGGTTTTGPVQSGTAGTAGQLLASSGASAVPTWTTPTYPTASATSGKIIKSDGTNFIASTETYAAPGTSGNVMTSNGTNWISAAPSAGAVMGSTGTTFFDDFLGENSTFSMPWASTTANGGINSRGTPTANRPGILRFKTSTSTNGLYSIYLDRAGMFLGGGAVTFECGVNIPTLSDGTDEYDFWVGSGDTRDGSAQTDGIVFVYDRNTSTNWQLICSSGGSHTARDTGVAVSAGAWIRLGYVVNAAGTSVQAYCDGVASGAAITTNIPVTNSNLFAPVLCSIQKSAGTTERTADLDYVYLSQTFTTPR